MKRDSYALDPNTLLSHGDFVRAVARSLLRDENRVDDVIQETWLSALKHPPKKGASLRAWLGTVVRNFALKNLREEKRRRDREKATARPEAIRSTDAIIEQEATRRRVVEAILDLMEPNRSAILLRFYDGFPPREIASRYGIPVGTVKARIQRGLEQMKKRLRDDHGGDRRKMILALAPVAGLKAHAAAGAATSLVPTIPGVLAMSTKVKIGIIAVILLGAAIPLLLLLSDNLESYPRAERDSSFEASATEDDLAMGKGEAAVDEMDDSKEKALINPEIQVVDLFGRVRAKGDERGIRNALVTVNAIPFDRNGVSIEGKTDASGLFSVTIPLNPDPEVTSYLLKIFAEDYQDLTTSLPAYAEPGIRNCGTFYLDQDRKYVIRVKDLDGRPIKGARIEFHKEFVESFHVVKVSDVDGVMEIRDLEFLWASQWSNMMCLVARAPDMADYYMSFSGKEGIPEEIVMESADYWTAGVSDSETGYGIPNARINVAGPYYRDLFPESYSTVTDENGRFRIPRPTMAGGFIQVIANAGGYLPGGVRVISKPGEYDPGTDAISIVEKFPDVIELDRGSSMKEVLVLGASTERPLAGLEMTLWIDNVTHELVTNEAGCLHFPLKKGKKGFVSFNAPGYKMVNHSFQELEAHPEDPWTLRLEPYVPKRVKIFLQDELGYPVAGASASIEYGYKWRTNQDRSTDHEGTAVFEPRISGKEPVRVVVIRKGFIPFTSEPFQIDPSGETVRNFVLKRGVLFQRIKVVDESGEPSAGVDLNAKLIMNDGRETIIRGRTDERGHCDMSFPSFREGIITVGDRPDISAYFNYTTILNQEWITLVLTPEAAPEHAIRGAVKDTTGRPVAGMYVRAMALEPEEWWAFQATEEDGAFCIPALGNRMYRLFFLPTLIDGRWYSADSPSGLQAGANIRIIASETNGIRLTVFNILQKYNFAPFHYNAWLESADGQRLKPLRKISSHFSTFFLGIPEGGARVVVETGRGDLFKSSLFEAVDGKGIYMEIEVDL